MAEEKISLEGMFDGDGVITKEELKNLEKLRNTLLRGDIGEQIRDDEIRSKLDQEIKNYLQRDISKGSKGYIYNLYNTIMDKAGIKPKTMEEFLGKTTENADSVKVTTLESKKVIDTPSSDKEESVPVLEDNKKTLVSSEETVELGDQEYTIDFDATTVADFNFLGTQKIGSYTDKSGDQEDIILRHSLNQNTRADIYYVELDGSAFFDIDKAIGATFPTPEAVTIAVEELIKEYHGEEQKGDEEKGVASDWVNPNIEETDIPVSKKVNPIKMTVIEREKPLDTPSGDKEESVPVLEDNKKTLVDSEKTVELGAQEYIIDFDADTVADFNIGGTQKIGIYTDKSGDQEDIILRHSLNQKTREEFYEVELDGSAFIDVDKYVGKTFPTPELVATTVEELIKEYHGEEEKGDEEKGTTNDWVNPNIEETDIPVSLKVEKTPDSLVVEKIDETKLANEEKRVIEIDGKDVDIIISTLEGGLVDIYVNDDGLDTEILSVPQDMIDNVLEYYKKYFNEEEGIFGNDIVYGEDSGLMLFLNERAKVESGKVNLEQIKDKYEQEKEYSSKLKEQIFTLETNVNNLTSVLEESLQKIQSLNTANEVYKLRLEEIGIDLVYIKEKLGTSSKNFTELTLERNELASQLAGKEFISEELKEKIISLNEQIGEQSANIAGLNTKISGYKEEIHNLNLEISTQVQKMEEGIQEQTDRADQADQAEQKHVEISGKVDIITDRLGLVLAEKVGVEYNDKENFYEFQKKSISADAITMESDLREWKLSIEKEKEEDKTKTANEIATQVKDVSFDAILGTFVYDGVSIPKDEIETVDELNTWVSKQKAVREVFLDGFLKDSHRKSEIKKYFTSKEFSTEALRTDGINDKDWEEWVGKFEKNIVFNDIKTVVDRDTQKPAIKFSFDDKYINERHNRHHQILLEDIINADGSINPDKFKEQIESSVKTSIDYMNNA